MRGWGDLLTEQDEKGTDICRGQGPPVPEPPLPVPGCRRVLLWFRGASGTCGPFTCPLTERESCSCSSSRTSSPCRGPRPSCSRSFRTGRGCLRWAFSPGLGAWLVARSAAHWPLPGHVQVLCKTPVTQDGKGFGRVGQEGQQLLRGHGGFPGLGCLAGPGGGARLPAAGKCSGLEVGELSEHGWGSVEGAGGPVGARQEGGRYLGPLRGRPLGS